MAKKQSPALPDIDLELLKVSPDDKTSRKPSPWFVSSRTETSESSPWFVPSGNYIPVRP
jgi:hypothetical protein